MCLSASTIRLIFFHALPSYVIDGLLSFQGFGGFRLETQFQNPELQRVPALRAFWDFEKTVLHEIHDGGTNAKIPHLHVHKPKTVVVETVVVETVLVIFV